MIRLITAVVILFTALSASASSLKICYEARFIFKLGVSCISYETLENGIMHVKSEAKTVPPVSAFKKFTQEAQAFVYSSPLKSKTSFLVEKGASYTTTHDYIYEKDNVKFTVEKTKKKSGEIKKTKKGEYNEEDLFDPFAATLKIQFESADKKNGTVKIFFEGKKYNVPYTRTGRETINIKGITYNTRHIYLEPRVITDGKLKPKGKWYFWVDEKTNMLVRMEVGLSIGRVKMIPFQIYGDKNLLTENISLN